MTVTHNDKDTMLRHYRARAKQMELICWLLAFTLGITLVTLGVLIHQEDELRKGYEHLMELKTTVVEEATPTTITTTTPTEAVEEVAAVVEIAPELEATCLGDYTITYYCACEICCDSYGVDRPTINDTPVVFTSTGSFAQEGITVAVDPDQIPYGTLLYIEGVGYRIAQDCGGAIQGNRIDVYMDTHEEALEGGCHEAKVYTIN